MSRIYVASLTDYNHGVLHGEWLDLTEYADADELLSAVQSRILDKSPTALNDPFSVAEEWAVHDYDGFGGFRVGEYEDLQALIEFSEVIEQHGYPFAVWAENEGHTLGEAPKHERSFEDSWIGHVSAYDYACTLADETLLQGVDESVTRYFDYRRYARDLEISGDLVELSVDGQVYLFRGNQ